MKKIMLLGVLLMFTSVSFAGTLVSIEADGLSELQKAELALNAAKMKQETAGTTVSSVDGVIDSLSKFQGIGKETGEAVSAGLTAVVDVAAKFGETNVGTITIALVVWRVVGTDFMQILMGFIGLFIGIWFYIRTTRPNLISYDDNIIPIFGGFFTRNEKTNCEYQAVDTDMKLIGTFGLAVGLVVFIAAINNI